VVVRTETVAKIAAYKAYRLGREAIVQGRSTELIALARGCLARLEAEMPSAVLLSRSLFYTLVLAELNRSADVVPYREAASELGEKLETLGQHNPFPHYIKIVAATDQCYSTGNFGDFTTAATGSLVKGTTSYRDFFGNTHEVDLARPALEISEADLQSHARFLEMSLQEIATGHGLRHQASEACADE
jgi:hypothetical protein